MYQFRVTLISREVTAQLASNPTPHPASPATILYFVPTRRLLPLVGALLFLLSACRVDVRIDVTADDTGAGNIAVMADLDAEAVTLVPGLAEDLRIDDLIASGWVIEGPTQINSGGLRVILRYAFESPAEAPPPCGKSTDPMAHYSTPNSNAPLTAAP